jgi:hypothetical protein
VLSTPASVQYDDRVTPSKLDHVLSGRRRRPRSPTRRLAATPVPALPVRQPSSLRHIHSTASLRHTRRGGPAVT